MEKLIFGSWFIESIVMMDLRGSFQLIINGYDNWRVSIVDENKTWL